MISLEQGFQFVLFVSYIALVGIQSFWMCSWTCSIPWSSIDASISLENLIWCHIIPWLNLVFLLLFPSHAIPSLKPSQSVLLHYGEKKKKKFSPLRWVGPIRPQQTSHLEDFSMIIKPQILVVPALEKGIDDLGSPVSFHVSPCYWKGCGKHWLCSWTL